MSDPYSKRKYKRELAYLESSGTQWIDTGLHSDHGYTYVTKLSPIASATWRLFWGRQTTQSGAGCEFFGYGNTADTVAAYFTLAGKGTGSTVVSTGVDYKVEMCSAPTDKYVIINGVKSSLVSEHTYSSTLNVYLFGLNNAGSAASGNLSSVRIYYWKAYEGDIVVRDFIPVLDNNNVPCMYDKVSGQLFYNQGTGTFAYEELPKQVFPHIPCKFPTPTGDYSLNSLSTPLTFIAEQAGSTIQLTATGTPITSGLMYREGLSGKWYPYTIGTEITLASVGDGCQFRNTNTALSNNSTRYVQFVMSGKVGAYGNIQSMLNYSSSCPNRCFHNLFNGCTALTKAPLFPAMNLGEYSYSYTFYNSGIVESPELPALQTGSASYYSMCAFCTYLVRARPLLLTTLTNNNCTSMFGGCSNLSEITVHFTEWAPSIYATVNWLLAVSSTGTFYKPSALSDSTRGESYIPRNWTVVNID